MASPNLIPNTPSLTPQPSHSIPHTHPAHSNPHTPSLTPHPSHSIPYASCLTLQPSHLIPNTPSRTLHPSHLTPHICLGCGAKNSSQESELSVIRVGDLIWWDQNRLQLARDLLSTPVYESDLAAEMFKLCTEFISGTL